MRLPFSNKRLHMVKRGRMGIRAMRVQDDDEVIGACVVDGKVEPKKPMDPREAQSIWFEGQRIAIDEELTALTEEQRLKKQKELKAREAAEEQAKASAEEKP